MKQVAYIITVLSILGTIANSFQKRWCFILWGLTNTFWILYNIKYQSYALAIQYLFNLIMSIVGYVQWSRKNNY